MNRPHPAFAEIFSNPDTTDILFFGSQRVSFDRGLGIENFPVPACESWNDLVLKQWILEQLSSAGKSWDAKFPFVDAVTNDGDRMHVAFPPVSSRILLSLRFYRQKRTNGKLWKNQSMSFEVLAQAVQRKETVLICGATGCGKTTLLNELIEEIEPTQRILALEEISELNPKHPQFFSLNARPQNSDGFGEIRLSDLLKQSLRMRPDRILLGECRGQEVMDLLQCLNTGHRGSLATLHANSTRDGIRRLELLTSISAQGRIPLEVIRDLIASGIQWIAFLERDSRGRRIQEISQVVGRERDTILLRGVLNKEK